jgi:hypothetical protein
MGFIKFLAYGWIATFGAGLVLSFPKQIRDYGFFSGIFMTAVGFVILVLPVLLFIRKVNRAKRAWPETLKQARRSLGDSKDIISYETDYQTGHAILVNPTARSAVLIRTPKLVKKYSLDDIREWATQTVDTQLFTTNALVAAGAAAKQAANTGFVLRVKDIEHPEWFISMHSSNDRARWMEIFNQAINEGGLAKT